MADRELIVLGCGTSVGVPMLGCSCTVCTSTHLRNQRTRASVLLRVPAGNILIDTTPELRLQLLREQIPLVHAVLYTHYHADHLFGLDDVRLFPKALGRELDLYCTAEVEAVIRQVFSYAFATPKPDQVASFVPQLGFERIDRSPFAVLNELITPIPLYHAHFQVLGFRIGNIAYCTDVNQIPEKSWPLLEGLDVLIIDALRPGAPHPSHMNLRQALETIERCQPRRAYLTHMSHEFDYTQPPTLPDTVELAYDGLRIPF
ncbi:MAG: MBL fold metallo-hydrolase [Gemmataceae bacterium]